MSLRQTIDLILLAAVWGASFLFMRIAAPELGAAPLVALRVGVAAAFLLPILLMRQGVAPLRAHPFRLFVLGIINSAIPFFLFGYAASQVPAAYSSILNATAPLWGALVAAVWLNDRLTPTAVWGLVLGFAGVVILVAGRTSLTFSGEMLAIAACLGATLCYGVGVNMVKRFAGGANPLAIATGTLIAATIFLAPFAVARWPADPVSTSAWLAVLALGVLCTGVAYIFYFRLIGALGPARAITVTYLIPVFGMIWGWLFLSEAITLAMVAGTVIILLGVALTTGTIRQLRGYLRGLSHRPVMADSCKP